MILVDAGPLGALFDRSDAAHRYKYLYSSDIDVAIYEAKPATPQIKDYSINAGLCV